MLVLISLLVSYFLVTGNTHRSISNAMPLLSSLLGPLSMIYASMMCSLCTCPVHGITISLDFPRNDLTPVDLGWKVIDHVSVHSSWKVIDKKLQQTSLLESAFDNGMCGSILHYNYPHKGERARWSNVQVDSKFNVLGA